MSHVRTWLVSSAVALTGAAALTAVPPALAGDDRSLRTDLTGAAEVPGPGDPDGTGKARVDVDPSGEVCYRLEVEDIEPAAAAHIHEAPAGAAGPIVVHLEPPTDGRSRQCTTVSRQLAHDLAHSPEDYYVNVHNASFPRGALRGQLG